MKLNSVLNEAANKVWAAERSVLRVLLNDSYAIVPVMGILEAENFESNDHQAVFAACLACMAERVPPSVNTVAVRIPSVKVETIQAIAEGFTTRESQDVLYTADIVRKAATLRRVQEATSGIDADAQAAPEDLQGFVQHAISMLGCAMDGTTSDEDDSAEACLNHLEAYIADNRKTGKIGFKTGIQWLDDTTKGFSPSMVWVIAAAYKQRKTTLARYMCINACRDGASVNFFSLENDKDYMTAGIVAMMASELLAERGLYDEMLLSDSFLIEGYLTKNQRQAVADASREFRGFNLRILDGKSGVATVGRMAMRLRRDKFIHGTNVFIVDYLQKMRGKGTLFERVEANTHEIQDLVTSEGLCGVMLAQRSEAAIKDTSTDNYSIGVKGGGDPSAAADFALLTKYAPKKNPNIFGIELALARHAMPSEHAHEINPSSGLIGAEVPVQ